MDKLTFDSFVKKIYINTPLEILYRCWATEEGICSWFLERATYTDINGEKRSPEAYIEKGDSYSWEWHNWDGQELGKVLEADGHSYLLFSFADVCKVSVRMKESNGVVLLTLKQYEIPLDEASKMEIYTGCSNGWTFWLTNLKAYLEHGILLNEKTCDLRNEPLAGHIYVNI